MKLPAAELEVAGGRVSLSPMPGRGGDLAADLDALADWGAELVVSLTEPQEMDASRLAAEVRLRGMGWLHLPVPDYGVPAEAMIGSAIETLSGRLRAGGRVAVHCMGGCGRSGALALRLMVLAGEPPDTALARLRAVRPCAVETEDQRLWASGLPPRNAAPAVSSRKASD